MARMRAVVYLWAQDLDSADDFGVLEKRCTSYANTFCWDVVDVIKDVGSSNADADAEAIAKALGYLSSGDATILLTADSFMISATTTVFNEINGQAEKHGFVQVVP